jgi:hypothetical protein
MGSFQALNFTYDKRGSLEEKSKIATLLKNACGTGLLTGRPDWANFSPLVYFLLGDFLHIFIGVAQIFGLLFSLGNT